VLLTGHENLPHGIFDTIEGSVVVWHPFTPGPPHCMANRTKYSVAGHVHFDPSPPPDKRGPEKIAGATPCQVWWNTGQRPATLDKDQDCTEEIRALAKSYRDRVLQPLVDRDPAAWQWLPGSDAVGTMSIEELLAMKNRAQRLIEGK
jgi:hypothetical protein